MLESLTCTTFARHLGERFVLHVDESATLEAELVAAKELGEGSSEQRAPFSIVFRVNEGDALPQRIYPLEHEQLGRLEIFLVPIGRDEKGTRYEAVFT